MRISIAMATYNGARYLDRQLQSFVDQHRRPDEVLICDDGSADSTPEIVEAFAARVPFAVQFIRNPERLGYNRNFASAIGRCTGDLVFVSDQDDEWYPEKLSEVAAVFANEPDVFAVVNDQDIVREDGSPTGATVLSNVRRLGYSDHLFGPGCCTALRRELLPILAPFPGDDVPYDHWINIVPELLGARRLIERPLQSYRRHGSNTSGSVFATESPSALHLARGNVRVDTIASYERKIVEYETILARLAQRRDTIAQLGLEKRYEPSLATLRKERDGYATRLNCIRRGRLARLPLIASMFVAGTYRQFQGPKSAVKDLLV